MAVTLASDALSNAEVTDGIGVNDVEAAARLWIRFWPVALHAARQFVEPAEVPGLAAEALIGTIAAIAVGRGPRDDVAAFVRAAVRELGEDDEPPPGPVDARDPEVFASALMSRAFAGIPEHVQEILWFTAVAHHADALIAEEYGLSTAEAEQARIDALTVLQREYLVLHRARAVDPGCPEAHRALAEVVENQTPIGLSAGTWVHLSACAWCTEAFHEIAFSNVAISSLIDRSVLAPSVLAPSVLAPSVLAPPVLAPLAVAAEPALPEPVLVEPVLVAEAAPAEVPLFADGDPVSWEESAVADEPVLASATTSTGGSHAAVGVGLFAFLRPRRGRTIAVVVAAAAAAAVIGTVAFGQGGTTTPPAATGDLHATSGPPKPSTTVDAPVAPVASVTAATASPTAARSSSSPTPHPTAQPMPSSPTSPKPTKAPRPRPTKTATTPAATPTSVPTTPAASPTPTPSTPPCNGLQHLLGFC